MPISPPPVDLCEVPCCIEYLRPVSVERQLEGAVAKSLDWRPGVGKPLFQQQKVVLIECRKTFSLNTNSMQCIRKLLLPGTRILFLYADAQMCTEEALEVCGRVADVYANTLGTCWVAVVEALQRESVA